MTIRSFPTLIAAAALAGSSLFAIAPAQAESRVARVGYADLDLSSVAGQRTLARRVGVAATAVCPTDMGTPLEQSMCRSTAIGHAHADLRAAGIPSF